MRVRAHLMMVMALDKCIGCHTCSVACKRSWTSLEGSEHIWFNNVETKPGSGYPRHWEDREYWGGGWQLGPRGELNLRPGGRGANHVDDAAGSAGRSGDGAGRPGDGVGRSGGGSGASGGKLGAVFRRAPLRGRDKSVAEDYYEAWTYEPSDLIEAPLTERTPAARPHSLATGLPVSPHSGPNWDDDLAGVKSAYEQIFMLYLPRICNHCLNPSCVAACPSKAIYKRGSDGIVLVDDGKCRSHGVCQTACPYRKVYLNRLSGKAEKCMFCLHGVTEGGFPTLCSRSCVGRIRSIGVVLYDADAVPAAAKWATEADLVEVMRGLLLDPLDPAITSAAEASGVSHNWVEAAQHSPVYALAKELKVALPLRPEFRTLPMVWYVPPLSPAVDVLEKNGYEAQDPDEVLTAVDAMRVPLGYLAGFLSAGTRAPVEDALRKLVAMRGLKRHQQIYGDDGTQFAERAGFDPNELERLFRLLAIAESDTRYVIPAAQLESGP
ncbi:MAG: nitrate reductase subunit beta [Actinobacteria bacterium]|nr:nitrate reductase subunit beta [Actinomycetota bacterium]